MTPPLPDRVADGARSSRRASPPGAAVIGDDVGVELDTEVAPAAPEVAAVSPEVEGPTEDAQRYVGRALGALFAPPDPPAAPGGRATGALVPTLHRLQRLAGNSASTAVVARWLHGVQRVPDTDAGGGADELADVSVTGVTLSADTVTLPLTGTLTATVQPADATGVTYSVAAGSVEPTAVTIDASTGAIRIGAGQAGGTVEVSADGSDGSGATVDLVLIERPVAITATAPSGSEDYGGGFTHTFSAPSGQVSGLEGANINERFDSTTATMPWGGTFTLTANTAGSHGWDLDASGTMGGADNVTIESSGVDIGKLVDSTSNPGGAKALPQGFTMSQKLFFKKQPSGALEAAPFATVPHTRQLVQGTAGPQFKVSAGTLGTITEDYSGPGAVTNARASSSTVMASPPRPESGEWSQRKVTVQGDPIPSTTGLSYSIEGTDLGCSVDADGEVSIGEQAGSITVRVSAATSNYDDVTITITAYQAPPSGSSTTPDSAPTAPEHPPDSTH